MIYCFFQIEYRVEKSDINNDLNLVSSSTSHRWNIHLYIITLYHVSPDTNKFVGLIVICPIYSMQLIDKWNDYAVSGMYNLVKGSQTLYDNGMSWRNDSQCFPKDKEENDCCN